MTLDEAIRLAEADKVAARQAVEACRAALQTARDAASAVEGGPSVEDATLTERHALDDAERAHRDAGRRVADLRRIRDEDAEQNRLQSIVAAELREVGGVRRYVETLAGWRERDEQGAPLPPGVVAYDAA